MNRRFQRAATRALLTLSVVVGRAVAQAPASERSMRPPTSVASARDWSASIAHRAGVLLSSPAKWNRADTTDGCPSDAKTFSIRCALRQAADEAEQGVRAGAGTSSKDGRIGCRFERTESHQEGSCGEMLDEMPVFTIEKVLAITTGRWRTDVQPTEVWAGLMIDASQPVMQVARQTVSAVSTKKYSARLIDFNNDSATTFADVQHFFQLVEDRLAHAQPSALTASGDSVEIEVYAGGNGVIRTFEGWYAISGFAANDSTVRFVVDTSTAIPPSALDRRIIERADAILVSDAVWNRADNRKCPATATNWSIYCALERAAIEVTGGFHHRRPALELVRVIVEERTKGRNYDHRLMDYNNDSSTKLADVRSLFSEALARVKDARR